MFVQIAIAAILTAALSYVVVKWLPLKYRPVLNILLLGLAGYLSYLIFDSVMKPIRFNEIKKERYAKVIKKLILIRDAEDAHKEITGAYIKDHDSLIRFIDSAQFAITSSHNEIVKVNKGTKYQPIMVEIERRVTDTLGYEYVKNRLFKNRDYKDMFHVADMDVVFNIETDRIEKIAGITVPVFEIKIDKAVVLEGLDKDLIRQEKEAIGGDQIRGPYLTVGSLEEVNSAGNWPPFYEKKKVDQE